MRRRAPNTRRTAPGNALVEFALTLPILIAVSGMILYMAVSMLMKHQAVVDARHGMWRYGGRGGWSAMALEGDWDFYAGAHGGNRPRGQGEDLERLLQLIEGDTLAAAGNDLAVEYWERLRGNLPGRHRTTASRAFPITNVMRDLLGRRARAAHWRDSSPWHFHHWDAWRIARSGPLKEIFEAFATNLEVEVAPHFEETRDDIIKRWWHGSDVLAQLREDDEGGLFDD